MIKPLNHHFHPDISAIPHKRIQGSPINEFKLTLDFSHEQNGYKSGDKLEYVEGVKKGKGSCWTKRSALIRLGFASDKGNFVSGIIPVKPGLGIPGA